jgi:hypothetical protein
MRDAGQQRCAITLAFEEFAVFAGKNEAPRCARRRHYGASHTVRGVGKKEFDDDLPAIFDAMDQPSIDGVNTWFVSKAAKEAGLKVALSGLGGDELLAGYPSFLDLPRWRRRFGPLAAVPGLGRMARRLVAFAPRLARSTEGAWPARPRLGLGGCYLLRLFSAPRAHPGHRCRRRAEGLQPRSRASVGSLVPDPGSDIGRVAIIESTQYRHQLLRDADWAGGHMAWKSGPSRRQNPASACSGDRAIGLGWGKGCMAGASHALPEKLWRGPRLASGVPTAPGRGYVGGWRLERSHSRGWSQFVVRSAGTACDKWLAVSR